MSTQEKIIGSITVSPKELKTLSLGEHTSNTPVPKLALEFLPNKDSDLVTCALSKIEEGDHYKLMYHFQNDSSETYQINVRNYSYEMA